MITLRAVREADVPVFFEHQSDEDAARAVGFRSRDWAAHSAFWAKLLAGDLGIGRAIDVDGRVAGNLLSWTDDGRRLVGYWLGREFWGRGIGSEALRLFAAEMAERPLYAIVLQSNVRSIRVLEKNGFVLSSEAPPPHDDDVEELLYVLR